MKQNNKRHQGGCPIAYGLDIFGDRWSLLVLREVMLKGKKTYGDFLKIEEGIATNILADRLKHLEAEAILTKSRNPDNRRSFIYEPTQKGRDLAPIIIEIINWSANHDPNPNARRETADKIKADRVAFEARIR